MINYNNVNNKKGAAYRTYLRVTIVNEIAMHNNEPCVCSSKLKNFLVIHNFCSSSDVITTNELKKILAVL